MKEKRKNLLPIIVIIAFTVFMIMPFIMLGQLGVHSDWSFHSARVQQLFINLKRGSFFTFIGTDTFSKVGNANFIFYPTLFLYPWVLLKFVFSPILAYLIYVWLIFVATGLIAYYSMLSFTKENRRRSIFFSLIYLVTPYHIYLTLNNYVLGEALAYTFIPLVLLGIYNTLYKEKWITLGISMTLMAYAHYVSLFISGEVILCILLCYLIQNKRISLQQIVLILKSFLLFLVLSCWEFVPLFTDYIKKNLSRPLPGFGFWQSAGDFVVSSISNEPMNKGGIGLLLLVTILFGWRFAKKDSIEMWIYLLGVLFTVMITTVFPWKYFSATPLATIQFPYRYTGYAIAFLGIILSKGLSELSFKNISSLTIESGIILVLVVLYTGTISPLISRNHNKEGMVQTLTYTRKGKYKTLRDSRDLPIIINNENYDKQFSYGALYGETDYAPIKTIENKKSVLNRVSYLGKKKERLHQVASANALIYFVNLKEKTTVDLPIIKYSRTEVYVNGKKLIAGESPRGTVVLKLRKGDYRIKVIYTPSSFMWMGEIIAGIGWMFLIMRVVKKINYRREIE